MTPDIIDLHRSNQVSGRNRVRSTASVPIERIETLAGRLSVRRAAAGTTDALLAEGRDERVG